MSFLVIGLIIGAYVSDYKTENYLSNAKLSKFYFTAFIQNRKDMLDMAIERNLRNLLIRWVFVALLLAGVFWESGPLTALCFLFVAVALESNKILIVTGLKTLKGIIDNE